MYSLFFSNTIKVQLKDWANAENSLSDFDDGLIGSFTQDLGSVEDLDLLNSRIEHLKAKIYEALEKREIASEYYCSAVGKFLKILLTKNNYFLILRLKLSFEFILIRMIYPRSMRVDSLFSIIHNILFIKFYLSA